MRKGASADGPCALGHLIGETASRADGRPPQNVEKLYMFGCTDMRHANRASRHRTRPASTKAGKPRFAGPIALRPTASPKWLW